MTVNVIDAQDTVWLVSCILGYGAFLAVTGVAVFALVNYTLEAKRLTTQRSASLREEERARNLAAATPDLIMKPKVQTAGSLRG
jgi:hypothetical protein